MSKQKNNADCGFAENIVAYIYGEMSGTATSAFEDHLADCQTCIDEFAAVADARYSVYEWQRSAFAPLETPVIKIPPGTLDDRRISWLDRLRAGFMTPLAAAAAVVVTLGLGVAVYRYQPDTVVHDLAMDQPVNTDQSSVRPTPVENVSVPDLQISDTGSEIDGRGKADAPPAARFAADSTKPKHQMNKARPDQLPAKNPAPRSSQRVPSQAEARSTPARKVPQMNDLSEEEDNSLRLAELFDDVDTLY